MDNRCPRRLKDYPKEFCPVAVARLRWIDSLGREPSEDEERSAPGCPWAVRNHEALFCFFKLMTSQSEPMTESQIAHQLGISERTVKKIREEALVVLREDFKEIKELYSDGTIIEGRQVDPYEDQLNDYSGIGAELLDNDTDGGFTEEQ